MRLVLDVSSNNLEPDWSRVAKWRKGLRRNTRVEGVYIKATEGSSYVFHTGDIWTKRARKVGLKVGRYHFAQPAPDNAEREADWFADHCGPIVPGDLRPCLDLEVNPRKMSNLDLFHWARRFSNRFHKNTGRWPIIYMSASWASNIGPVTAGLWLASWSNDGRPWNKVPAPGSWPEDRIFLHQFTSEASGRSPLHPDGVMGRVDISKILDDTLFVPSPKKKKSIRVLGGGSKTQLQ